MIVTFTANPSLDRTVRIDGRLRRGDLHRLLDATVEPGGKGINVARAVHLAGREVVAVLPASPRDRLLGLLGDAGVRFSAVDVRHDARVNLSVTEPDGTTTKLNEPGPPVTADDLDVLRAALVVAARRAHWVVLSGSLPPGAPHTWYIDLVTALRDLPGRIAVEAADGPLAALAAAFPGAAPDLLVPNAAELGQLAGIDGSELGARARCGDFGPALAAARGVRERGVHTVLGTLGQAGAVLVVEDRAWSASSEPVVARSPVGAGDAALAGYLLADTEGSPPGERLRLAVAYGVAAVSLSGSAVPRPAHVDLAAVTVREA